MSYGTDDRPGGPTLEDFIARQHWAMIGSGALFQVGLLGLTSVLMAVPVTMALALVHLMALVAACFGAMAAESLAERGDRPRAVLADSLLERSDPRGEFIALQLAPSSDPKVLKRAATLLKKHARRWLGPLAAVVAAKSAVFERGFPVECVARATRREQAEIEFGLREWATVERLTFAMLPSMDPAIAVLTPAMKHVRSLAGVPVDALDRLALLEWPRLEHLGIRHRIWLMHEGRAQGLTALARAKLPALRSLSLLICDTTCCRHPRKLPAFAFHVPADRAVIS